MCAKLYYVACGFENITQQTNNDKSSNFYTYLCTMQYINTSVINFKNLATNVTVMHVNTKTALNPVRQFWPTCMCKAHDRAK